MEIDARDANAATVDAIRFSGDQTLTGSPNQANVKILQDNTGNQRMLCAKSDIPNLIKALQLAMKQW